MTQSKAYPLRTMIELSKELNAFVEKKLDKRAEVQVEQTMCSMNKKTYRACEASMILIQFDFDEFVPNLIRTASELTVDIANLSFYDDDYLSMLEYQGYYNKRETWRPLLEREHKEGKIDKLNAKVEEAKNRLNRRFAKYNTLMRKGYISFAEKMELLEGSSFSIIPNEIELTDLEFLFYFASSRLHSALVTVKRYDNTNYYADMFAKLLFVSACMLVKGSGLEESKRCNKLLKELIDSYVMVKQSADYKFDIFDVNLLEYIDLVDDCFVELD